MAWTDEELRTADLVHGPEAMKSDTYRLRVEGKWLDVPGWMVGDPKQVRLRVRAAEIIRERLLANPQPGTPLGSMAAG